ncbi:AAA family ATPase [Candidatus Woesearchaeota archaeon]|nr:AAA family ATPase [Candidatus Woesearchaeota archaeon]
MTKYIAIVSGKGGVGKTTTAINLGFALSRIGRDVTIVDCFSSSLKDYLGLNSKKGLHDVLAGRSSIGEATYVHPYGVKVVPSHKIDLDQKKSLSQAMLDIYGKSDIVLLDGVSGFGSDAREIFSIADEAIFVSGPDEMSAKSVMPLINAAESLGSVSLGIVINNHSNSRLRSLDSLKFYGKSPLAVIPYDRNIPRSFSANLPVLIHYPGSKSSLEYLKLANLFWKNG